MNFIVQDTDLFQLVSVQGEIAFTNACDLQLACFRSGSVKPTIVDLRRCSYLDSSGLAVLADPNHIHDVALVLTSNSRCYRIFELTDLLTRLTIAPTIGAAYALLR